MKKRRVILVTDGDQAAKEALEIVAKQVDARCISLSAGNPSPLSGPELVELIKSAVHDPVLVMFDDCGYSRQGIGEQVLKDVATHAEIDVLGAIAVASNCMRSKGTPIQMAINNQGHIVSHAVDKNGYIMSDVPLRIFGDTVEVLNEIQIPIVIGMGDIGKMREHDDASLGCPITRKAIDLILNLHN
ncbi:stage V sporulation protein AE [Hazenella sp. IB182353]|uniref:stage V sporulation protein AE n=1 Tax=Polycladospora coralii TaxID=2771432 RepID=UPI001746AE89|nr:stage V sporulation protein AE [Polycladospora coralii]MBS7530982.1 stage V sporulation protein AE [Polycladospora coralii]